MWFAHRLAQKAAGSSSRFALSERVRRSVDRAAAAEQRYVEFTGEETKYASGAGSRTPSHDILVIRKRESCIPAGTQPYALHSFLSLKLGIYGT
jgi:hypothetical protein